MIRPALDSAFEDLDYRQFTIPGDPVAKPRQTRSDKWKKRPCVVAYRNWADRAREVVGPVPDRYQQVSADFYLPFPASYSKAKRAKLSGRPHRGKPDIDNLLKALLDALFPDDSHVWSLRSCEKFWHDGSGPRVELQLVVPLEQ